MPPRRAASTKAASSKERQTTHDASVASTPRRSSRAYQLRGKKGVHAKADLYEDEPDTPDDAGEAKGIKRDRVVPDTDDDDDSAGTNPEENSRMHGRTIRNSSDSSDDSLVETPSRRSTLMKNKELVTDTAAMIADKPDEPADEPTSKKRRVEVKVAPRITLRKSRSKWEDPDEMLTNPKAPLAHARLRDILCSPESWEILTPEEQRRILAKFPDDAEILDSGTPSARPDIVALLNNNNFRYDVERYKEGLRQGFHEPDWILQAQAAHRSREAGVYDDFLAADFENRWGMSVLPQSPARNETTGDLGADISHSSKTPSDNAVLESEITGSLKNTEDQTHSSKGTLEALPVSVCRDDQAEIHIEDQNDDSGDPSDSKTGPAHDAPETKNETDRSHGHEQ